MVTTIGGDTCEKPGCDQESEKTYRGEHGNKLRLCGKHYYKLVTGDTSEVSPLGLGTDDGPFIRGATNTTSGGGSSLTIEKRKEMPTEPEIEVPVEDRLNSPTKSEVRSEE